MRLVSVLVAAWLALACVPKAAALYGSGSDVRSLSANNFESTLANGVWIVEFFAPWCGHCKSLAPEWEKAATALKGIVGVAALDADAHGSLAQQYDVKGFPTIKLFYKSGPKLQTVDYNGGRTAKDVVHWAVLQAQKIALARLGVKAGGSSSSGGRAGGAGDGFYGGTNVESLTDANFHGKVSESEDLWFVEFYAPWCGHCKALKPSWIELAGELDGRVRVGAVDCDTHKATCSEFGVSGFPTLKFFGANKARPEAYDGPRETPSLAAFAAERWARAQPPPEVHELSDQEVWVEHCLGHEANEALSLRAVKPKQLCLVAFLPHILDAGAEGRQVALAMLQKVAEVYKDRPFAWFWAQGGDQPGLEANLGVGGYGYPALVALNPGKKKYAPLRGAFQEGAIKEFMDAVRSGRERVADVSGEMAAVRSVAPWDGKDAEVADEEEFSLEDLGIGGGDESDKDEL